MLSPAEAGSPFQWRNINHPMMLTSQNSSSHPVSFILLGIPGLENYQFWVAFPFCAMYVVALVGNITLLHVIRTDPTLHHKPHNTGSSSGPASVSRSAYHQQGFHRLLTQPTKK